MNKAILIGRLVRDPEVRYTASGEPVATFTIAIDRRSPANAQGQREADFIPIVTFRKTAELCAKYIGKGRLVGVSGRIQTRNYTAQDGTKRYVTEVVCDEVQFLERPPEGATPREMPYPSQSGNQGRVAGGGNARNDRLPQAQQGYDESGYYPDSDPGMMPASTVMEDDDDLPF